MENVVFTMGSSSSPRTLLEAMAWASRGWPSKLCSTRRMGCMLASLQTIKISAPLKPSVDSASTPSIPTVICKGLYNWWLSLLLEYPHHYCRLRCPVVQELLSGHFRVLRIVGIVGRAVSWRRRRARGCIFAFPAFAA
jgi:hypothetical protein